MVRKYSQTTERNFLLTLGGIFLFLSFLVIFDILRVLVLSSILAYFLYPLYIGFKSRFENNSFASLLTLTCATMGFFFPILFMFYFLILNLGVLVLQYQEYIKSPELLNEAIIQIISRIVDSDLFINFDFSQIALGLLQYTSTFVQAFLGSLPLIILQFFVILFITYYLLVYSSQILKGLNEVIPLRKKKQKELLHLIARNLQVLFKGYFLTGVIQTVVAFIGYIILDLIYGFPNLLIVVFLTLLVSLLPYIGPPLVWVPISIYYFIIDLPQAGTLLFIYGITVISLIDNFVRPILMSDKDTISPPLVFIGFVGGTFAFGVIGLIIGPIIISITTIILRYLKEYYHPDEELIIE